tara:strand:+ start:591 stop:1520 length:930 start_codon:yes stop_codon:yes gene_type:complete
MIPFYLSVLPGEHIYSWYARRFWLSGFFNKSSYLNEIGIKPNEMLANLPLSKSSQKACRLGSQYGFGNKIASETTVFPLWALSMEHEKYNYNRGRIHHCNVKSDLHVNGNSGIRKEAIKWKACPDCIEYDLKKYGTSYWHVKHQFQGCYICYKHGSSLVAPENEARTLKNLFLPHQIESWVSSNINSSPLHKKFSVFCSKLFDLSIKKSYIFEDLKIDFWALFKIKSSNATQKKLISNDLNSQLYADLGSSFLSSIFNPFTTTPHSTEQKRIIHTLVKSSKSFKVTAPVFWAVALFWKRDELKLFKEIV